MLKILLVLLIPVLLSCDDSPSRGKSINPQGKLKSINLKNKLKGLKIDQWKGQILNQSNSIGTLDLSDNPSLIRLPSFITKLKNLKVLDISNTGISDFSNEICDLKNLKILRGRNNTYKDNEVPYAVFCIQSLEVLDMSASSIMYIDEFIYKLTSLKELHMKGNQLNVLPGMLKFMPSVLLVDFTGNHFTKDEINSLKDCTDVSGIEEKEECRQDLSDSIYCEDWHELSYQRGTPLRQRYEEMTGEKYAHKNKCYHYWINHYLDYENEDRKYLLNYTINGKTIREWRVLFDSVNKHLELDTDLMSIPILGAISRGFHREFACARERTGLQFTFTSLEGIFSPFWRIVFPKTNHYLANSWEIYPNRYQRNPGWEQPIECAPINYKASKTKIGAQ